MSVIKGLTFFFLVMLPGLALFAFLAGGGAWLLLNAADTGVTRGLELVGVPSSDTDIVIATVVVAFFVYLVALALSRDFKRL
jgi:hypothetical protein